ncbi:hypothetical protein ParaKuw1_00042 [Paracoccus phage ParKuw1]|uniref:Uncharacterized protein n=1 Tax=Paracoccus phage ParKuw1 TaxID=3032415 RepID=A0AAF0FE81_9CAUD|nr:hypothetical protein ParaKuw1_00042 [Paracoccus phage ParKuw1]
MLEIAAGYLIAVVLPLVFVWLMLRITKYGDRWP